MATKNGARARYQEIESWLRERVLAGREGDPLPAEAELATLFNVSRMTARQAVQNLAAEGLVRRRRGSGTYVAPRPLHRHSGPLMSFTADMRRRGMAASSKLISAELRNPTSIESEALRIEQSSHVVSIVRLRLADSSPMAIEYVTLTADCAPVLAADLEQGSLHDALNALGRQPTIALTWISARAASAVEAKLLELRPRSPLLIERRIISDQNDRPLEHTETAYLAERYVIDAVFTLLSPENSSADTDAPQLDGLRSKESRSNSASV